MSASPEKPGRSSEDEIPDLDQLFDKLASGAPGTAPEVAVVKAPAALASAKGAAASAAAEVATAHPPPAAGDAATTQNPPASPARTLAAGAGAVMSAAAEPGEEGATSEFQPVAPLKPAPVLTPTAEQAIVDATSTGLYNPSVGKLLDRMDAPEVAVAVNSRLGPLNLLLKHLKDLRADLREHKDPEDLQRPRLVELSTRALDEAQALSAETKDEEDLAALRQELLDAAQLLGRLVDGLASAAPRLPPPEKTPPPAKLSDKARPQESTRPLTPMQAAMAEPPRRGRIVFLIILAVGLVGYRATTFFSGRGASPLKELRDGKGAATLNPEAAATEEQLAGGVPGVLEARLVEEDDGTLHATALVLHPTGQRTTLSFKWFEDGALREVESRGLLRPGAVKRGATYHVEIVASDGTHESSPVATPKVVAGEKSQSQAKGVPQ